MLTWMGRNLILLVCIPFFLIARLFFSKKTSYVFYSPLGYKGNTRYLHEHFIHEGHSSDCLYISRDMLSGMRFFKTAYHLLFAKVLFLTHGLGRLPITFIFCKRIQLWHGLPIKKILLDADLDTKKFKSDYLNKVYEKFYQVRIRFSYHLLITSDAVLGYELAKAFRFNNTQKVKYLGTPSIDYAYKKTNKNKELNNKYRILYLPTWRDGNKNILNIIEELYSHFTSDYLALNNIELCIKLHPYDLALLENMPLTNDSNINILKHDVEDIISFIDEYDCLITDYSSVCFEYYPLNKPMIFFTPDYNAYCSSRGFYLDIKEISEHKLVTDYDDLKMGIVNILNGTNNFFYDLDKYIGNNKNALDRIYKLATE